MKAYCSEGKETFDDDERRKNHRPEVLVAKLRDTDAMLNSGTHLAVAASPSATTPDNARLLRGGVVRSSIGLRGCRKPHPREARTNT